MAHEPVHYEVFTRKTVQSGWALEFATEVRALAVDAAKEALSLGRAIGVRVAKESRLTNGDYQSVVIFSAGDLEPPRRKSRVQEEGAVALCVSPSDLYTVHARERIGRLLEPWLLRHSVCPFELLHRPDLVERLDASGLELQHAMQKVAIPEAQAQGVSTHEVIRRYQRLVDGAVARLLADHRRGAIPDIAARGLAKALQVAHEASSPAYVLGAAVAAELGRQRDWAAKLAKLLELAEAGAQGGGAALLFQVLEQPMAEILGGRLVLDELLGGPADLGRALALILRMISPDAVKALEASDPALARAIPALTPEVARLARWLDHAGFKAVRAALGRRVLADLNGPRRLHPQDPAAEIQTLRCLARLLILSPQLATADDVQAAFIERSRRLTTADFVHSYVEAAGGGPLGEANALIRLADNVVGLSNKRAAAAWLKAAVGALRFEREIVGGAEAASVRLAHLADLQHALLRTGLDPQDHADISAKLGELGDAVEKPARLVQAVARSPGGAANRVLILLKLASGEGAPVGPVTRRAKLEVAKLMRDPAVRTELAHGRPEELDRVRLMLHTAGLAA